MFPKNSERKTDLLDIIHSDVCGPMRVESLGKAKYFVTFIDDCSKWCEVYFLRTKSEVFEKFKEFQKKVENQKERKVKCIQSDNGKEYVNKEFDFYLREHGIVRRLTVTQNPEQNGTAERKNRTLLDMARCILIQSGLPPSFWAEAISTANYIRNRCPTRSLNGKTPYEAWTGNISDVSNLKEFGCQFFFQNSNPERGKFDERGKKGIFLGYSDQSKAYRVWVPDVKKTVITRDIVFKENSDTSSKKYEEFAPENFFEKEGNETRNLAPNPRKIVIESIPSENFVGDENQPDDENQPEVDPYEIIEEQDEYDENREPRAAPRRVRGRPAILRTGTRGRPRKVYQTIDADVRCADAEFAFVAEIPVKEAMNGSNSEEWL